MIEILSLLLLWLFLVQRVLGQAAIRVHLDTRPPGPVKMLSFCVGCFTPEIEGSFFYALTPKYAAMSQSSNLIVSFEDTVVADLVMCVPNFADKEDILNRHSFTDRVVYVDRGVVTLLEKAQRVQEAGALGLIIGDDGQCREDFSFCGIRAGSKADGGFSAYDDPFEWSQIDIPIFLITKSSADRLKSVMATRLIDIPGLGQQLVTIVGNEEL